MEEEEEEEEEENVWAMTMLLRRILGNSSESHSQSIVDISARLKHHHDYFSGELGWSGDRWRVAEGPVASSMLSVAAWE